MNGVGLGARAIKSLASEKNDKQPAQLFKTAVTAATKAASTNEFPAVLFFLRKTPGLQEMESAKKETGCML